MTRTLSACAALVFATAAFAQPMPGGGGAASRPTFSPYLNLLNRGNNPGLNYLGIVRPQQQMQQQFNQLQSQTNQQLQNLGQAYDSQLDTLSNAFLPATGNVSTFGNVGGYFGRIPFGSSVFGGSGGGGSFGGGGMSRFGGSAGAMGAMQRPGFAGGGGVGGGGGGRAPAAGGRR